MPVEVPAEAEGLLLDLANADALINQHRTRLDKRQLEIAEKLAKEVREAPASERAAMVKTAAEELVRQRRIVHRSELAHLAAAVVNEERRRARILAQLDAFDLGEGVGHLAPRDFTLRGTRNS